MIGPHDYLRRPPHPILELSIVFLVKFTLYNMEDDRPEWTIGVSYHDNSETSLPEDPLRWIK